MGTKVGLRWIAAAALVLGCGKNERPNEDAGGTGEDGISGSDDAGGGPKLDVGDGIDSAGPGDCGSGGGNMGGNEFSIIWIANSPEGTVSKIDTKSRQELARFYSGPSEGDDDPSRTSVNLSGDVAVTNRGAGITKIAGDETRCIDGNANGSIETSTGPGDVLAWGEDECVLWNVDLPGDGDNRHGPRPTAWDFGGGDSLCDFNDDRVWVGWYDHANNTGVFRRLDGATGAELDEVKVPDWDPEASTDYGPYGGAVDGDGNFWVSGRNRVPLLKIDGVTLDVARYPLPDGANPYGIAMDANGHPWLAGTDGLVLHFRPGKEEFTVINPESDQMRGLMVDTNGYAWIAANNPCGAIQVDTKTDQPIGGLIDLPNCQDPVGVSIDADGFVWLPDRDAEVAHRLNPNSFAVTTATGLVGPYTYSDMTGAGLGLVTFPPAG